MVLACPPTLKAASSPGVGQLAPLAQVDQVAQLIAQLAFRFPATNGMLSPLCFIKTDYNSLADE